MAFECPGRYENDKRSENHICKVQQVMLLHGEQYLEMRAPLPASGILHTSARVLDVQDKGKAAVVVIETTSTCAKSGKVVAVNEITSFMRGAGGFGKRPPVERTPAAVARNAPPEYVLLPADSKFLLCIFYIDW